MSGALILTLGFDPETETTLNRLRERHFPPERNVVPAHLTLFHQLPGDAMGEVIETLRRAAAEVPAFGVRIGPPFSLGKGVALRVSGEPMVGLRRRIAVPFDDRLSDQDRGWGKPHVTIQNKVAKEEAAETLHAVRAIWADRDGRAERLDLWHYRGGPWEEAASVPLRPA